LKPSLKRGHPRLNTGSVALSLEDTWFRLGLSGLGLTGGTVNSDEFMLSAEEMTLLFFFACEPLPPIVENPFPSCGEPEMIAALEQLIEASTPESAFLGRPGARVTLNGGVAPLLERCRTADRALTVLGQDRRAVLYTQGDTLVTITDSHGGFLLSGSSGKDAQEQLAGWLDLPRSGGNPGDDGSFRAILPLGEFAMLMEAHGANDVDEVGKALAQVGVPAADGLEVLRQTQAPASLMITCGIPGSEASTAFIARESHVVRIMKVGSAGSPETAILAQCGVDEAMEIILER